MLLIPPNEFLSTPRTPKHLLEATMHPMDTPKKFEKIDFGAGNFIYQASRPSVNLNGSDAQHFSRLQCTSPMTLLSSTLRFGLFTMNHISHHRASPIISSTQSGYRAAIEKEFSPQWRSCAQIFSLKFAKANKIELNAVQKQIV